MSRYLSLLLVAVVLAALLPASAPAAARPTALDEPATPYVPLPRTCGGGLPPGQSVPACCLFGYVFVDGRAVAGAQVTVTNARGRVVDWSGEGPDSDRPYFRLSLSDAPLRAQPGESVTIAVSYGGYQRSVTHTVLNGAQQMDLVVPTVTGADYVFERQLWGQTPPGMAIEPRDITVDAAGTIYALDTGNSRVQVFSADLRPVHAWGLLGDSSGALGGNAQSIAPSGRGTLYVVDSTNGRVQEFTGNGAHIRTIGERGQGNGQFVGASGVAVNSRGAIYVSDISRVQRFSPEGAWEQTWGSLGAGDAQFDSPGGIAIDADDNVYVADRVNHRIKKYTRDGALLWIRGGKGEGPGQLQFPTDVAVSRDGLVYVADSDNARVQIFSADGEYRGGWGQRGAAPGQLGRLRGLTLDGDGNLLVADTMNSRFQKFTPGGALLNVWGAPTSAGAAIGRAGDVVFTSDQQLYVLDNSGLRVLRFDRSGRLVRAWPLAHDGSENLQGPYNLTLGPQGELYVADWGIDKVQKYSPEGALLAQWGGEGTQPGQMRAPAGVVVGSDGLLYVADANNHRIQVFTLAGAFVRQFGRFGTGPGQMAAPWGLAFDQQGNLLVVETNNHRIQKFSPTGQPLGLIGARGTAPGQFTNPRDIVVTPTGNLLVTDAGNSRVQLLRPDGQWLKTWGKIGSSPGSFDTPFALALAPDGRLAVGDTWNNRVQLFTPAAYTRPIATLVAVSTRSVTQGQPITLHGAGADSDETPQIAALEWFLDGAAAPFATGPTVTLATAALATGRHTISLRVRDTEGETSDLQSTTVDVAPANSGTPPRWTFLLYLGGDAPNMASFLSRTSPLGALYRLERAAPNAQVTVAALYDGPLPGGGDSFYYLFRPDGSFTQQSLGEVNMGDPQTLVAFARWGLAQAPADHTYLALADHADAIDGTVWDTTTDRNERLTPGEVRDALVAVTESGARPIDVLHFDGCLMGLIEPAYQVRGLARYLVASENLGWSAFAYDQYRSLVGAQSTPRDLASAIAGRYAAILRATGLPFTIATLDLAQVDPLARAIGLLADELLRYALVSEVNRLQLAGLRAQVQKLDSGLVDYRLTPEDEYVDLDHWAELVGTGVADAGVRAAAATVRQAHAQTVLFNAAASGSLAERLGVPGAGYGLENARGVGIYYPPRASVKTYQVYIRGELHFVREQGWDEYLAAGLTVLPFDPAEPEPRPVEPLPLPEPGGPPAPRVKLFLPVARR